MLISDLFEGGDEGALRRRAAALVASGVSVIALLALSDDGAPAYDHDNAQAFAALGVPTFACTPDQFPELHGRSDRTPRDLQLGSETGDHDNPCGRTCVTLHDTVRPAVRSPP